MKTKQLFIGFIIILLATTLLFPKTDEQRYCHQYSGESDADRNSDIYKSCQDDTRCKVDEDSILSKYTHSDVVSFMCIPVSEVPSNSLKDKPQLPE